MRNPELYPEFRFKQMLCQGAFALANRIGGSESANSPCRAKWLHHMLDKQEKKTLTDRLWLLF